MEIKHKLFNKLSAKDNLKDYLDEVTAILFGDFPELKKCTTHIDIEKELFCIKPKPTYDNPNVTRDDIKSLEKKLSGYLRETGLCKQYKLEQEGIPIEISLIKRKEGFEREMCMLFKNSFPLYKDYNFTIDWTENKIKITPEISSQNEDIQQFIEFVNNKISKLPLSRNQ